MVRDCRLLEEFCEDSGVPSDDCPFCQQQACAPCGWTGSQFERVCEHDYSDRHEGVQAVEAVGL